MKRMAAVLLIFTALLGPALVAADDRPQTTGLRLPILERLQEVQTLAENDELNTALRELQNLQREKLWDYELAQTWFLTGYIRYRQEDFPGALQAYERSLESQDIPIGMRQNVLQTLSQLCTIVEDYPRALRYIEQLLAISKDPTPDHYALKAQLHYQLEDYDPALAALEMATRLQRERGAPPKENWLLLKNAIYYERKDYRSMLGVLQQLLVLYPRDRHLLNMAAIYGELGNSEKQLSLMEPLYDSGRLNSPSELLSLAGLYMMHDIPYKGAVLLDKALERKLIEANQRNLDMLAQAWLLAAEKQRALEPLRQVAEKAKDGEAYVRLARIYMSLQRWRNAENALVAALEKGKLKNTGDTELLLGLARLNQKKFRSARSAFAQAGQHSKTEKLSRQWLQYLQSEEEKAAVLDGL